MAWFNWKRSDQFTLSAHFGSQEFICRCGLCSDQKVDGELIRRLELVRVEVGVRVFVTSGFRCDRYQEILRNRGYETAKGRSSHQEGQAADLTVFDPSLHVKLIESCKKYFTAYGIGRTFVHVDLRPPKNGQPRVWSYA